MSAYLDTSVLVAAWLENDSQNGRAIAYFRSAGTRVVISDFAAAEFASALGRGVRTGRLKLAVARRVLAGFDTWRSRSVQSAAIVPADVASADAYLRRLDLNLRAPDAIHIAAADRLGAMLVTFDAKMAVCAHALGVPLAVS